MTEKHIELLTNYKELLERNIISMKYKIDDYTIELNEITEFLKNNCNHEIVTDHIDSIKNENICSDTIKYCAKCKITLH